MTFKVSFKINLTANHTFVYTNQLLKKSQKPTESAIFYFTVLGLVYLVSLTVIQNEYLVLTDQIVMS